ncbi:MAG: protein-L-isoaspartate(D-aspartate) O-methyltransferase [Deltaproteobacteria bacterium]|nr:protein-L-isoaspartate(D-aspartate) O-methyltransferase [Deltaproteobacteria bacterium]
MQLKKGGGRVNKIAQIEKMLQTIASESYLTQSFTGKAQLSPKVMNAMGQVLRADFVPAHLQTAAYDNRPLPIGNGQTISQPFIVALMTDLLNPQPDDIILEIGTGSGYQAAILSLLVKQIYTIECIPTLAEKVSSRLQKLGYANIEVLQGDGRQGWPEKAPFDGIIVTAAAPQIPQALCAQLKPGGSLVIPVGQPYSSQELIVLKKKEDGEFTTRKILPVAFVPLTGKE